MIERVLQPRLLDLATRYPVLTLTGPRQSGKTTLSRMAFPDRPYVSLENPASRELARRPVRDLGRRRGCQGAPPPRTPAAMSFYRDSSGLEIDVILERGTDLVLVEVKSARTPSGQLLAAFERFAAALAGSKAPRIAGRVVVYGGDESQRRGQGEILSWREMDAFDWAGG